jgi:hypothetical protein
MKPVDLFINKQNQLIKRNELVEISKLPIEQKVRVKIYKSKMDKESDNTYSKIYYVKSGRKYKSKYFYKLYDKQLNINVKGTYSLDDLRIII